MQTTFRKHISMKVKHVFGLPIVIMATLIACSDEHEMYVPEAKTPSMEWEGQTVNLVGENNGWAVSRLNNWVAITNIDAKSQIYLSWDGDMTTGIKENPVLTVAANGTAPVSRQVTSLTLENDGKTACFKYTLADGTQSSIIISLLM